MRKSYSEDCSCSYFLLFLFIFSIHKNIVLVSILNS
jgi:hypothetical protein